MMVVSRIDIMVITLVAFIFFLFLWLHYAVGEMLFNRTDKLMQKEKELNEINEKINKLIQTLVNTEQTNPTHKDDFKALDVLDALEARLLALPFLFLYTVSNTE